MATSQSKYFARVGGSDYVFSGADYIYRDLGDDLGIQLYNERAIDTNAFDRSRAIKEPGEVRKALPRVIIVLALDAAFVGGNAAQEDSTRRFKAYCDPGVAEAAITNILGATIDGLGVVGDQRRFKVIDAYFPRRRCYV
jgi:hypothetical protein